ncbi:hypothetical protein H2199_008331 [Coniosporium tulheliwenetii]|uniref:Uncharacterized protein n=1 Tax=Coniosporium tulheliwenetii TaxID=3383036 RepID=A0ACC2YL40_9PEZI|nr:hypothetical protein H2199_008331 [Cladosporium sp. JES 115]
MEGIMEPEADSPIKDDGRGRRRTRDDERGDDSSDNGSDGQEGATGSSRKRRRSRKGLDKKFECPQPGCGKSYSRAEHLYRHQLNHNPKQIYHCDFPDCHRSFVRQDLCARHKERHTARGSQMLRKEGFVPNINPIVTSAMAAMNAAERLGMPQESPTVQPQTGDKAFVIPQSPASGAPSSVTLGSDGTPPIDQTLQSSTAGDPKSRHSYSEQQYGSSARLSVPRSPSGYAVLQRHSSLGSLSNGRSQTFPSGGNDFVRPSLPTQSSAGTGSVQGLHIKTSYGPASAGPPPPFSSTTPTHTPTYPPPSPVGYNPQQNFPSFSTLPPPGWNTMSQTSTPRISNRDYTIPTSISIDSVDNTAAADTRMTHAPDATMLGGMTPNVAMPMFGAGADGFSRSPFAMADDFTAWLFNDSNFGPSASPIGYPSANGLNMMNTQSLGMQAPYLNYDPAVSGHLPQPAPAKQVMAVHSILDITLPESALSEEKRQQLLDLITGRFNNTDHAATRNQKEELLDGDMNDERHVLSLTMMQTYISSYWAHFHAQVPILHRPTFNAATCPPLLLLALMALGASCLEKSYGLELTEAGSQLSKFIAWHLRWEIFMDADFRPPAKLWVFQALLLLEIFEKLYSTRPLHERAHIHHATTLTLMRRGSSLIGRSSLDSPPVKDSKASSVSGNTAVNHSGINTPDEWWNRWITNEATRRAAFAAFVMDSIHATMFGHSAVMVAHEMRLPLPCDEVLWSATSSAEVARLESNLQAAGGSGSGNKPITFLDGLKKTLNGQPVRTNPFGRTILMAARLAGLVVGGEPGARGRDRWRGSLTRAFDFWKRDFDESLVRSSSAPNNNNSSSSSNSAGSPYTSSSNPDPRAGILDTENTFESRTVLHHLAHMAMHVDIVDCQIFARAHRLLGRSITAQDYAGAARRMKEGWAPTARARDATFYALRFLRRCLVPGDDRGMRSPSPSGVAEKVVFDYSARDDFLLNRPWVLYFACLIVWSYGYALDGPLSPPYSLLTREERVQDLQGFLRRVGGVRTPEELSGVQNRNACLGLLILMKEVFEGARWELLHEAGRLLGNCVEMLVPGGGAGV